MNILNTIVSSIGNSYEIANTIYLTVLSVLSVMVLYHSVYTVIGLITTRKFRKTENKHKYAVCIAARNEEAVIGNLLDSIAKQDYPKELVTVFVVADNCTDSTADVCIKKGAVCYERFDNIHKTKGFALQFLFKNIEKDYGIDNFEGYFVFDADNLLNSDYITRMNEAFDEGEKIITSYRNTKNFDENWIASTYAIHWLRSIRFNHRARSVLRLATNIQGTGFLFANELVKDGWNYTSLTEDRAFTADAVANGYPISYCDAAMFYDEQPTNLKIALRQRIRWSKGHLMAFTESGPKIFKHIFTGVRRKNNENKNVTFGKRFIEAIRCRWASYDIFTLLLPSAVIKAGLWLLVSVIMCACFRYCEGIGADESLLVFRTNNFLSQILNFIFGDIYVTAAPGLQAALKSVLLTVVWNLLGKLNYHISVMLLAACVFVTERKRIIKMPLYKKIFYCITWPIFDIIGRWTTYFALFMKVEWKPIPHTSTVTIGEIEKASKELVKK